MYTKLNQLHTPNYASVFVYLRARNSTKHPYIRDWILVVMTSYEQLKEQGGPRMLL